MKKRQVVSLILSAVMAVSVLSGCGGKEAEKTPAADGGGQKRQREQGKRPRSPRERM